MNKFLPIGKYSFGIGDRFARQAQPQLQTCLRAAREGADIVPVWNKSNREHLTIGSEPGQSRAAAAAAVQALHWAKPWFLDANHIRLDTVDRFLPHADFYTIDVADSIAHPPPAGAVRLFLDRHGELTGEIGVQGIARPFRTGGEGVEAIVNKYLLAVLKAGKIYRHIAGAKGTGGFVTETTMDEAARFLGPRNVPADFAGLEHRQQILVDNCLEPRATVAATGGRCPGPRSGRSIRRAGPERGAPRLPGGLGDGIGHVDGVEIRVGQKAVHRIQPDMVGVQEPGFGRAPGQRQRRRRGLARLGPDRQMFVGWACSRRDVSAPSRAARRQVCNWGWAAGEAVTVPNEIDRQKFIHYKRELAAVRAHNTAFFAAFLCIPQ